jgi:hypothetical protein
LDFEKLCCFIFEPLYYFHSHLHQSPHFFLEIEAEEYFLTFIASPAFRSSLFLAEEIY